MKLRCKCGSAEIHRDAWAEWDDENQEWRLGDVYDEEVWCPACGAEGWSHIEVIESSEEEEK